ncbi:hypothetical protein [Chitinophaga qingshengii]|uniref:DUF1795 domain-containing protein n=1 Tax=Chitinophaga qingshengii TaxID=1569794 RepID=A0ABR7TR90_9BACT|nr:hypothetical protein [Chitinophaga qingshengii]MBC9933005.1 hypothetical protein [Chitinophaga qingshengii]
MKYFFLLYCLLLQLTTKAQTLFSYKDSIHRYVIGIPEKWKYWKKNDSTHINLLVYDMEKNPTNDFADNFNITIFHHPNINVDSALYILASLTAHSRLSMLDTGSYMVDGKRMLWFDDVHIGPKAQDTLCASDFIVYNDSKVYIITCTTTPQRFATSRDLFHRVAQSFKVSLPPAYESLKIDFPTDVTWKIQSETDDSTTHAMQLLPIDESAEQWTRCINLVTIKQKVQQKIEQTILSYKTQVKESYPDAHFTVLSKGGNWGLFKVETNHPKPEASLFYVLQTDASMHTISITFPKPTLSDDLLDKWTKIFRNGKLVME